MSHCRPGSRHLPDAVGLEAAELGGDPEISPGALAVHARERCRGEGEELPCHPFIHGWRYCYCTHNARPCCQAENFELCPGRFARKFLDFFCDDGMILIIL